MEDKLYQKLENELKDFKTKMKENGVELTPISDEEREYFKNKISYLYEDRSQEEKEIIKAIQEL